MGGLISAAISPYLTYIKIAAAALVFAAFAGLGIYAYIEHREVSSLTQQVGAASQTIADENANIKTLETTNANWQKALAQYQQQAQAQADAVNNAVTEEEKLNAQVAQLRAQLSANPQVALQHINADNGQLVCMLNYATGNQQHCGPAAAGTPGPAKASSP
jgi:ABC-type transporter Mla subunit MlaD